MESTDEEFVWTNTSKDDSDSEVEMPYEGESESGKSYKKKLQKELFHNGELDSSTEAEEPKKRKKKHKRAKSPVSPSSPLSPARLVKREPRASGRDEAAGEYILNMKVKEERASFVAPRDSPRKRRASSAEPDHAPKKKKKKRERKEEHESSTTEAPDKAESPRKKKKRKRDSERTSIGDQDVIVDKFEAEDTVVERRGRANGHAQEDEPDRRGPGSAARGYTSKEFVEDDDSSDDAREPRGVRVDTGEGARNISKRITFEEPQAEPEASKPPRRISEKITFEESQAEPEASKPPRRISEKITFEESQAEPEASMPVRRISERITFEESEAESESPSQARRISERITFEDSQSESEATAGTTTRLARYVRARAQWRPAREEMARAAAVTAEDEVWVLRAPRDLDARDMLGVALAVDARSKLKVGGRALEAAPAGGAARVALLLPARRGFRVRAVPTRGVLRLRARPPRARAPLPPSPAEGEEGERVPLPATRARHPLLGAGYEQAAALPPRVRRRLAAAARDRRAPDAPDAVDDNDVSERREQKKKKKKRRERPEQEAEVQLQPETEEPKPKKRKRKHSCRAEPEPCAPESPPRKKKVKKEKRDEPPRRAAAAVWDSERGIEESLFNF